jgi:hypothetical protein
MFYFHFLTCYEVGIGEQGKHTFMTIYLFKGADLGKWIDLTYGV